MPRIKLIIAYDGSNYHGYQKQKNGHSIEAELEKHIRQLSGEEPNLIGASRTDAGVHALGQVVAFDSQANIPGDRWHLALNSLLPEDIRVLSSQAVPPHFHPQFQAQKKRYKYIILRQREAAVFFRRYALCNTEALNIEAMQEACAYIEGHHNFKAFCARRATSKTFDRTVYHCYLEDRGRFLLLNIEGNGFLYNMVRIIMGTLLEVGRGKLIPAALREIIASGQRAQAGPTAPPQGLYLVGIDYLPEVTSFSPFL